MARLFFAALLYLPFLFNLAAAQNTTIQLCIANMQVVGNPSANPVGRDLLLKFLHKEKPGKTLTLEYVPLDASAPDQALAQSKQKNCDYVVNTNQTESHSSSSQGTGAFAMSSEPTFYVTTKYQLNKVSDGAEVASGSFKASDHSSEQNAIGFTMHKIADKVTETINKAGPTT